MTPSERKFLFVIVRDALQRGSGNEIEPKRLGSKYLPVLRSLGFVEGSDLTRRAFEQLFTTFEPISCPNEVRQLTDSLGIEVYWKRPHGVIKSKFDSAGEGSAYRNLKTVFISDGAKLEAWYHELGHMIFGCVKNNSELWARFKALQQEATAVYPVVTHEQMTPVQHPVTNKPISPAPGQYVLINGRYHGLDHSGDGMDGAADELWASLFEEYHSGRELKPSVRGLLEQIIAAIKALPKPLDPCDKD